MLRSRHAKNLASWRVTVPRRALLVHRAGRMKCVRSFTSDVSFQGTHCHPVTGHYGRNCHPYL